MKLLKAGWVAALALAAVAYPVAAGLAATATEAWLISPHAPAMVELNRALETPDKAAPDHARRVAQLYGVPSSEPIRVVFVPKERFLRPVELPSLTLLPVDKSKGENPLQVRTLYFFAGWTVVGGAGSGVLLGLLWRRLRSRAPEIPPTSTL